ncbi:UNVERIFIED_CONTAM: Tubulin-folding cofactor D [Sesamum radiatum]|uniref:Tubulin-folding cofactor D n=1 Tax=Sesamum radiatum TaxID=300843 RepID=A0AAW2KS56_SESRA
MDKYQEQGQLIEPYLESIVSPLMDIVRSRTMELGATSDEILEVIKPISIIIYSLVTVCGYKSVIKFFPHQVSDLELAVSLLEKCHNTKAATSLRQESTGEMETKCIILLWLSILVLIPFDISSVDTSIANSNYAGRDEPPPLVVRILEFCKDYLSNAGPMRTISGLLLSRLLTRPDMSKAFTSFIDWTHKILSSAEDNIIDHFRLLGAVEALAAIFKSGSTSVLLNVVPVLWNDASVLMKSRTAARSSLLRKYLVKLTQRIALTCLPHRSATWRYMALHYDIRRGPHSVGSHVRDAAAYVCWAFGRAYYYGDMKNVLEQMAPHLLTVACYDRENAAVEALRHYVPAYLLSTENKGATDIVSRYLEQLTDPNVAARRGSALALGVLPFEFLAKEWKSLLIKLCSSCEIEVQTPVFCAGVLDSLSIELRGTKDFSKLYCGIAILGYIASLSDPVNQRAFSHVLTFLGHRYPKIRKSAAEQMYLVLLENGDLIDEDKLNEATEIITETCWEADIEEAKKRRLQLCEMANLGTAQISKATEKESKKVVEKRLESADENASYSSLVGSAGF